MKNETTLFASVNCNAGFVQSMSQQAVANGLSEIALPNCGFVLVGKKLVPYAFLTRLQDQLSGSNFQYGPVLDEAVIFDEEFLLSLDPDEREVLMPCVLILIERGDFGLNLFASVDEEVTA